MPHWLKRILSPRYIIPVFMIAGIGLLFVVGQPSKIVGSIARFNVIDLLWAFLLTLIYEGLRFTQWWFLLKKVGVRVPMQAQVLAFAGREPLRYFPVGDYFENYLLTTAEGVDFGLTSAVTTMSVALEVAVCLTGLVVLGLGNWWQIRPGIVGCVGTFFLLVWLVYKFHLHGTLDPPAWARRHQRIEHVWEIVARELKQFWKGARRMTNWRTLTISFAIAAAYVTTAATILYVALAGIGWHRTPFSAVVAVYFFNLAVTLILPLPSDFGISELTGVGAFLLVGVDTSTAASALLLNRGFSIVFPVLIAAVTIFFVRDELKKALRNRGSRQHDQGDQGDQGDQREGEGTHGSTDEASDRASRPSTRTIVAGSLGEGAQPIGERDRWRYDEESDEAERAL